MPVLLRWLQCCTFFTRVRVAPLNLPVTLAATYFCKVLTALPLEPMCSRGCFFAKARAFARALAAALAFAADDLVAASVVVVGAVAVETVLVAAAVGDACAGTAAATPAARAATVTPTTARRRPGRILG